MLTGATNLVRLGSKQYPRQEHLEAGMSYGLGGPRLGGPCMSGPPVEGQLCHVQLLAVKAAVTVCILQGSVLYRVKWLSMSLAVLSWAFVF